jgi:hypothetical protein
MQLSTTLPAVLSDTASNLSVARSLLVIVALQLLVLAVAALLATARLLVTQREGETALLNARGADRWQLTRLTAAEVIPLCGLAAVIGGLAGIRLAALLATAGPLRSAGIHMPGPSLLTGGAFVLMSDALASRQPTATPNVMLLNGPGIDTARATALVSEMVPAAGTMIRSEILGSLTGAPVQRGAFGLFILALVVAAGLGWR